MDINYIMSPSRSLRITYHIFFWMVVLSFYTFFYGRLSGNVSAAFIHLLVTFPLYIGATYITLYLILPRTLLRKKYSKFLVYMIYLILGTAYAEIIITILLIIFPLNPGHGLAAGFSETALDIYLRLLGIFIVVFFASSFKLLKHWFNSQKTNQLLATQKLEAELNMLKNQIHPHFLFNTLNNLYALTLKKSDKSPEVVLKLSGILDYIIYQCNEPEISLNKEINLIRNYIDLEKLRFNERASVDFDISGVTDGKYIAPIILFPFIENAFKHGVNSSSEKAMVGIKLKVTGNRLFFSVINSKPLTRNMNRLSESNGKGLENVKKRLELIYPGKYKLNISDSENKFVVELEIEIAIKLSGGIE